MFLAPRELRMTQKVLVMNERRKSARPAWHERIMDDVRNEVTTHDGPWRKADPLVWQTHYLLLKHLEDASRGLVAMGTDDGEMAIRRMFGLYHDIGKIFEPYSSLYRKKGLFSLEDTKIMKGHAKRGEQYVLELSRGVRLEDRQIFKYVATLTGNHHTPWLIFPTWLRKIAWDLYILDGFLAGLEKRHDDSKTVGAALASTYEEVKGLPAPVRFIMREEIRSSIEALERVVMTGELIQ